MAESKKDSFNASRLSQLADLLREFGFGDILRALPTYVRRSGVSASPYAPAATLAVLAQQADAPAVQVLRAYARAGTGTAGDLIVDAPYAVPAAGHIAVDAAGQLVTAAADAWTDLDVVYTTEKGELVEVIVNVVPGTGVAALPQFVVDRGVVLMSEAEALVGGATGKKIILAPAAAAPAAGNAVLNLAKGSVFFAIADAVTSARLKLFLVSAVDVNTKLSETATSV